MDPILAAKRLPKLAERAIRNAIIAASLSNARGRRATPRVLVDDALIGFERLLERTGVRGIRPALLFAERDRIARELHAFVGTRLASRLLAVRHRDVVAVGREAGPFDAVVHGRRGGSYGIVLRRLARDGRRLETMRAIRVAARDYRGGGLRGVLVYDLTAGTMRTLRCGARPVELIAA
jgi:hypothetical protein